MIKLYRGNNIYLSFQRKNASGVITTTPQEIYFTFKKNCNNQVALFQKRMTAGEITLDSNNKWTIAISPADTANLDFGKYVCDVKVIDESGHEYTIVPPAVVELAEVATHYNYNEG